ncbi:hypothetical protein DUI87_16448 [Hirundo rustica rustica]|uniref:Uncharacterized protein n=1 Tax=Hirundo rustica rustica TaxID=333673 RepID=A0A3M0K198_HIRRU|nr:hypothetical protein DUI87_16448 [Hirundo rustica rustica]
MRGRKQQAGNAEGREKERKSQSCVELPMGLQHREGKVRPGKLHVARKGLNLSRVFVSLTAAHGVKIFKILLGLNAELDGFALRKYGRGAFYYPTEPFGKEDYKVIKLRTATIERKCDEASKANSQFE